jgi:hypothetical protein
MFSTKAVAPKFEVGHGERKGQAWRAKRAGMESEKGRHGEQKGQAWRAKRAGMESKKGRRMPTAQATVQFQSMAGPDHDGCIMMWVHPLRGLREEAVRGDVREAVRGDVREAGAATTPSPSA